MSNDGENWHVLTDANVRTNLYAPIGSQWHNALRYFPNRCLSIGHRMRGLGHRLLQKYPERVTSFAVARNTLYIGTEHRGVLRLPFAHPVI